MRRAVSSPSCNNTVDVGGNMADAVSQTYTFLDIATLADSMINYTALRRLSTLPSYINMRYQPNDANGI